MYLTVRGLTDAAAVDVVGVIEPADLSVTPTEEGLPESTSPVE